MLILDCEILKWNSLSSCVSDKYLLTVIAKDRDAEYCITLHAKDLQIKSTIQKYEEIWKKENEDTYCVYKYWYRVNVHRASIPINVNNK